MAKKGNNQVDLVNDPIRMARDLGWMQIQAFLNQNPRPPGELEGRPRSLTEADIRRLSGKE
jgi:hypothetical protein